jgi:hypothetical protein
MSALTAHAPNDTYDTAGHNISSTSLRKPGKNTNRFIVVVSAEEIDANVRVITRKFFGTGY